MLITFNGHADRLVFMIQLTSSTFMFVDIVLNIYKRCHIPATLKLHQQNDSDFTYQNNTYESCKIPEILCHI